MSLASEEKLKELREKLSIELCDNFISRLNPAQQKETKLGALIALRNFIKESKINDPIIFSFLVDAIIDPDKEIKTMVTRIVKEVKNAEIIELLQLKLNEVDPELKKEISSFIKSL